MRVSSSIALDERVAHVRAEVFALAPHLERMAAQGSSDDRLWEAAVAIQRISSQLGIVQSVVERHTARAALASPGERFVRTRPASVV